MLPFRLSIDWCRSQYNLPNKITTLDDQPNAGQLRISKIEPPPPFEQLTPTRGRVGLVFGTRIVTVSWKRISGILCDRRISLRVKGKVYKTVVRLAMMYGAETWAVKKAHEKKLDVAEMRMLRWMSGVTKMDRIRNERIRGTTKVGEISKKVQESVG